MKITRFKFDDHGADWHLEETAFDPFNLLVGVSGVGKTKILEALRRVCRLALESGYNPGLIEWHIEFEQEEKTYKWSGRTEALPNDTLGEGDEPFTNSRIMPIPTKIASESVLERDSTTLIHRDASDFIFQDEPLPRLINTVSAIVLLENEKAIAPIRRGFKRALFSKALERPLKIKTHSFRLSGLAHQTDIYRVLAKAPDGLSKFKEALAETGLENLSEHATLAAYYMQEAFPEEFIELRDIFTDIFPSVDDVRVIKPNHSQSSTTVTLELAIREKGVGTWVMPPDMSSGMLRTLIHTIETFLAPPGSVIVIDEFENGLGVNCLSDVARLISKRADCQIILTSHHPYIINAIPVDAWKLVTRKGGQVRVTSARDIPEMQSASRLEAFTQLINLKQFVEEGIQ